MVNLRTYSSILKLYMDSIYAACMLGVYVRHICTCTDVHDRDCAQLYIMAHDNDVYHTHHHLELLVVIGSFRDINLFSLRRLVFSEIKLRTVSRIAYLLPHRPCVALLLLNFLLDPKYFSH